jgi:hypothetical protein
MRMRSVASRLHDLIQRLAMAFIRGTAGSVGMTRMPVAWKTASKLSVKYAPRSRMRNLIDSARLPLSPIRGCCILALARSASGWPRSRRTAAPAYEFRGQLAIARPEVFTSLGGISVPWPCRVKNSLCPGQACP